MIDNFTRLLRDLAIGSNRHKYYSLPDFLCLNMSAEIKTELITDAGDILSQQQW